MAEITYRIPSRAVQYGYVEITRKQDDSEPTDPELLAAAYVNYVYAFQKEEEAAIKRLQEGVSAPVGASQGVTEEQAQRYLDEGLGGVTAIKNEESPTDQAGAPWDRPQVDSKPKPWESVATAPAAKPVVDSDW